jgi:hypothetical protein
MRSDARRNFTMMSLGTRRTPQPTNQGHTNFRIANRYDPNFDGEL